MRRTFEPVLGVLVLMGALQAPAMASSPGSLRQEAFVSMAIQGSPQAGTANDRIPVTVGLRLDTTQPVAENLVFRAVLTPQLQWMPLGGQAPDAVALASGLSEAYLSLPGATWDLSLGLERWSIGEMRLAPILTRDTGQGLVDARGVFGMRATGYLHPWRIQLGVTAESSEPTQRSTFSGGPIVVGPWSLAASLRYDAGIATLLGHVVADVSSPEPERVLALGASSSTSVASLVLYGDAWWLAHAASLRGGIGVSGYAGDILWTLEAAWAAAATTPFATGSAASARPVLRAQASTPISLDQSLDVVAGVALPQNEATGALGTQLDASLTWARNRTDDTLSVTALVAHQSGVLPVEVTTVSILWSWTFHD